MELDIGVAYIYIYIYICVYICIMRTFLGMSDAMQQIQICIHTHTLANTHTLTQTHIHTRTYTGAEDGCGMKWWGHIYGEYVPE